MCCFFKQKTADEMRISDWSSDVCSSDLKHARHDLLLIVKSLHLAHRFFSPLTGRAGRRLYNGDDSALVLLRKEAARETREQDDRQADQRDEYCEPAQRSRQDPSDAALITVSRTRSEEHTSELQSLMRNSYAVFCLTNKNTQLTNYE